MKNSNLARQRDNKNSRGVFGLTLQIASKASEKSHTFFFTLTNLFAHLLAHLLIYLFTQMRAQCLWAL